MWLVLPRMGVMVETLISEWKQESVVERLFLES